MTPTPTAQAVDTPTARTPLKHRLAAIGAAGALALGGGLSISTALDTAPAVAAEQQASQKNLVPISQFGIGNTATEQKDCGPASAVMAILAQGGTPKNWDPNNPGAAVAEVRNHIGHQNATVSAEVVYAIGDQGMPAHDETDFTGSLDEVRNGKTAILNGWGYALPYDYGGGPTNFVHWITVADYDKKTDTFTVLDSNGGLKHTGITQAQLETFQASVAVNEQMQIVVG